MSESNKNKKSGLIILIIIYLIVAVLVTIYLISFYNKNNISAVEYYKNKILGKEVQEIESPISFLHNDDIDRVSLDDRYSFNNIEFNEIRDDSDEIVYESEESDYKEHFREISYYQIDGLKNKKVQSKINKDIEYTISSLKNEAEEVVNNGNDIYSYSINSYIMGNFNDILSIEIYRTIRYNNTDKTPDEYGNIEDYIYEYETRYLNYRLDTGNYISFKDCFTKDASIKNILIQNYYVSKVKDYSYRSDNDLDHEEEDLDYYGINMDYKDYSGIEDDLLKFALDYEKNKDEIKFYFSECYIVYSEDDYIFSIDMLENYEYIDLGKKYISTNSLYEKGNLDKINFIYCNSIDEHYAFFDKVKNNKFLALIDSDTPWKPQYVINTVTDTYIEEDDIDYEKKELMINKLKEYIKQEESEKNKGYIYSVTMYREYDDTIGGLSNNYEFDVEKIEIENDNFDKNIQDIYYKIFNNIEEGYTGFKNLDVIELRKYNYEEYYLKEYNDNLIRNELEYNYLSDYDEEGNYIEN